MKRALLVLVIVALAPVVYWFVWMYRFINLRDDPKYY